MGWLKNLFKSVPSHEEALIDTRAEKRYLEIQCAEYTRKIETYENKAMEALKRGDQEAAKEYAAQAVLFEKKLRAYKRDIHHLERIESYATETARTSDKHGERLERIIKYANTEAAKLQDSNKNLANELQTASEILIKNEDVNEYATQREPTEIYSDEAQKKLEELIAKLNTETAATEQIKKEIAHKAAEAQAQGA